MKYLVISDIHGDLTSVEFLQELNKKENFDKILLLGDVLYHGPRNDLPKGYNPKGCIKILNEIKDKILCIKGNCDAEVDQMVLEFKINDYLDLNINGLKAHLEHGHHLDLYNGKSDIILSGHTHIPVLEKENDVIHLNPGSISIPKNGSKRDFAIWNDNNITIYDMDMNIVKTLNY